MKRSRELLQRIYSLLLDQYGPQGWWPIPSLAGRNGFDERGYHPGEFGIPATEEERFEVIVGAILTQNTAWTNVELALRSLREQASLHRDALAELGEERLASAIRPSGYFRQKARKLKAMLEFLASGESMTRENLLGVWGVGPETADSILLYGYHRPFFVVDAYTRRILDRLHIIDAGTPYDEIQSLFHAALPADVELYNEYHALIVAHAKRYYSRQPYGEDDPLLEGLPRGPSRVRSRKKSSR